MRKPEDGFYPKYKAAVEYDSNEEIQKLIEND